MCGIIGYAGRDNAVDRVVSGLYALEYRGYDSAGIAAFLNDGVITVKCSGRVERLSRELCERGAICSFCAIGHTRWATHGAPCDINSHPHTFGRVTVVHNGIIENYREIARELGINTVSETDTEVCAALIDSLYDGDPLMAIFSAMKKLCGQYALGIIFSDMPGKIYAVKKDSPLLIGIGDGENYIASDITAVTGHTKRYIPLADLEAAEITQDEVSVYNEAGKIEKDILISDIDDDAVDMGDHAHFMEKEIFEEANVLRRTLKPFLSDGRIFFDIDGAEDIERLTIVACGTARHAGLLAKYYIEKLAHIHTDVEIASEYIYSEAMTDGGDIVLAISQSGETADTIAAVRLAKARGARTLAVVNVRGSTLAREADGVIYTSAGPEIAVASTKAYVAQVAVALALAVFLARAKKTISQKDEMRYTSMLIDDLPLETEKAASLCQKIKTVAEKYCDSDNMFFIGRGADLCVAKEGSLKLKEISYIHSEAYAAGELKHGAISLITKDMPTVAVMTCGEAHKKTLGSIREIKARGGRVIALCCEDISFADDVLYIDCEKREIRPIVASTVLQLFAYYMAVLRGCDIDKPRNLAKSVTVE